METELHVATAMRQNERFIYIQHVGKTQNPAIINLLREFDRKRRADPDKLPVVRLKANGYQSKNYGYQYKPVLVRVAWANRDDAAKPDTSTAADMNDELPW